jgi:nicotinate phosphoribosyltransferase
MTHLSLYGRSLALLTDLYELTMACGYWRSGIDRDEAVFHLSFRSHPFRSGFTIACGLHTAFEFLHSLRFTEDDLSYLKTLRGSDGRPLFEDAFLEYLGAFRFECDVDAIPEGTVVFPLEPLIRVQGPLLQAQLLETALLNMINFESLIATKAARVVQAAQGDPVLEFGLRRAQGIDGGVSASRAAYVGGCAGTSNVLAARLFGIPAKGTHAHSWVMCFDNEQDAFDAYGAAMPNNCILLVDTYDTLEGVRNAIRTGQKLRAQGYQLAGIRLDSGDLAGLSREARRLLDESGFSKTLIVGSSDLDEHAVQSLKRRRAPISVWGVGTRLVTAYDQPALAVVYKLSAIRRASTPWRFTVKRSEQTGKSSIPGILQVRRFLRADRPIADAIFNLDSAAPAQFVLIDPAAPARQTPVDKDAEFEDLLIPIFRRGAPVYELPALPQVRARTLSQLSSFEAANKRLVRPGRYPVGLEQGLDALRRRLLQETRATPSPHAESGSPAGRVD